MSRRCILGILLMLATALPARAQVPLARDLVPTRTALARVGLERQLMLIVPMQNEERLLGLSMSDGLLFAQTDRGYLHAYDAESGQALWTNRLGTRAARARPVAANSFAAFATNLDKLYAIDRRTGSTIWRAPLGALPSSSVAADEDRVMVGLANGKIYAFGLKTVNEKKEPIISSRPLDAWNWQANGAIETRPLPAMRMVAFGSDDGKVYVAMSEESTMLYRIATGGPIGQGLGTHGTRLLIAPSADRNLYGIDLFTSKVLWTFPSGSPITQEPMVAGNDIYVVNTDGQLTSVDPTNGKPRWTNTTRGGRLLGVGPKRVYLESTDNDLFVVDRGTGQMIADPRATYERAGLNLRAYEFAWTNRQNDRLYFGTTSGMIIGLREIGQTLPVPLRDPKALPFGEIPREGVQLTPPPASAPKPEAAPAEEKPEADAAPEK